MLNIKEITKAVEQIANEKGLESDQVLGVVEDALASAYKKEYVEKGSIVRAKMDSKTGELTFWRVKEVVDPEEVRIVEEEDEAGDEVSDRDKQQKDEGVDDEDYLPRYNSARHIFLEEAKEVDPDVEVGGEVVFPLEDKEDFGRIAAQVAKQTIIQKVREAERTSILDEWRDKEGSVVSGMVQRVERGHVYVDFGRAVGVMFANESIPGEHYRQSERLRFLVLAVQEDARLPGIILSRAHPNFVKRLFEMEVPEIAEEVVEIKDIAREPGSRTKLAVISHDESVDPIGACVGQRGTRVMAVNNEIGQEKIDIIEWSEEPERYVAHSLSPAEVEAVEMLPRRTVRVYVPEDQLSLAIGRGGQNVRMAAKLTGWKIDVRSQTRPDEVQEGGVAEIPADAESSGEAQPEETAEEQSDNAIEKQSKATEEQKVDASEDTAEEDLQDNSESAPDMDEEEDEPTDEESTEDSEKKE